MANNLTTSRLRRLADLRPEHGQVLSVYLNLDPSEFPTPAARASAISSLIHDAQRTIAELSERLENDDRKALRSDVESVREILEAPDIAEGGTHGIAVFACAPADLLETVRLAHPVQARVVVDETPYVAPLVEQAGDERWCVVLANRRSARIFLGAPETLEETDRVEDDVHSQYSQGAWSQGRHQRAAQEDVRDHLGHVAEVVFDLHKRRGTDRLLIGATEETKGELERRLHPYLRERLAGRVHVDVEHSSLEEVRAKTAEVVEEIAREREREALDRLRQGIGAGGRAAAGLEDVLAALGAARAQTLLLSEGFDPPERERVVEKALESAAEVIIVRYHDDLELHGGIAALLRY
jgi:peptide chain release factor subunit 1